VQTPIFHKLEFPFPKDTSYQIWFKSVQWFWRRSRLRTDDGRTTDDGWDMITIAHFGSGELKMWKVYRLQTTDDRKTDVDQNTSLEEKMYSMFNKSDRIKVKFRYLRHKSLKVKLEYGSRFNIWVRIWIWIFTLKSGF